MSGSAWGCGVGRTVAVAPSIGGSLAEKNWKHKVQSRKHVRFPGGRLWADDGLARRRLQGRELRVSEGTVSNESRMQRIRMLAPTSGEGERNQGGGLGTSIVAKAVGQPLLHPPSTGAPLRGPAMTLCCVGEIRGRRAQHRRFAIRTEPVPDWIRARRME